jgi:hypothetical protein
MAPWFESRQGEAMSSETMRQGGSFVVRIWWEQGDSTPRGHWRGWVQHVRRGTQIYFTNLRDLNMFIEQEIGADQARPESQRGLV